MKIEILGYPCTLEYLPISIPVEDGKEEEMHCWLVVQYDCGEPYVWGSTFGEKHDVRAAIKARRNAEERISECLEKAKYMGLQLNRRLIFNQ